MSLIATPQGGFIAPLYFKRLPLFSILYDDYLRFSKNRDKEYKLRPMYFYFPRTGNYITSCI